MAHVTGHFDESALLSRPTAELGRLSSRSLMLGAIGAVGIALGLVTFGDHFADAFWQSYLIGYIFWIGITLGALGILMIQHLTGGAWTMIVGAMALIGDRAAKAAVATNDVWVFYPLNPAPDRQWLPIAWVVLSLIGTGVQLGFTGGEKGRVGRKKPKTK